MNSLPGLRTSLAMLLTLPFLLPTAARAQTAAAPVPPLITQATSLFVSNAGADSGLFPSPFSGDVNRGYNQLYAALQANGKYHLADNPSQADLVLELQLTAPNGPTNANKQNGASNPLPMFRLVVYDRKSHYALWAFTQSVDPANLQKTHDRNFDDALNAIALEFEALSGKAVTSPVRATP